MGVIGVGVMGATHARNVHAEVVGAMVAGVTDVDLARAKVVASECGPASVFENARRLIRSDRIDAVVIASPHDTHAELVLECLQHEKPVLCEKPLAMNSEEARKILDTEARLGRKLVQVGFMRRYDQAHIELKEAATAGRIGQTIHCRTWHRTAAVPARRTTELLALGGTIHGLDSVRWLLGQEVCEVYARGLSAGPSSNGTDLNLQLVHLSLEGSRLATVEFFMGAGSGYEVGVELVGESGTLHSASVGNAHARHSRSASGRPEGSPYERFRDAYISEITHWVNAVRSGDAVAPDAWDGYASVLTVEACVASFKSGSPEEAPIPGRPLLYEPRGSAASQSLEAAGEERRS